MTGQIETRCTQCGTVNVNGTSESETKNGTGSSHGTEVALCDTCSGSCDLDECITGNPCERCRTETVQNRCGSSVPTARQ
jgi:hypothetical protein